MWLDHRANEGWVGARQVLLLALLLSQEAFGWIEYKKDCPKGCEERGASEAAILQPIGS